MQHAGSELLIWHAQIDGTTTVKLRQSATPLKLQIVNNKALRQSESYFFAFLLNHEEQLLAVRQVLHKPPSASPAQVAFVGVLHQQTYKRGQQTSHTQDQNE